MADSVEVDSAAEDSEEEVEDSEEADSVAAAVAAMEAAVAATAVGGELQRKSGSVSKRNNSRTA